MSHVAFCVQDFDRSLHFYRDLLGFQVAQEGTETEASKYQEGIYERENRKFVLSPCATARQTIRPTG